MPSPIFYGGVSEGVNLGRLDEALPNHAYLSDKITITTSVEGYQARCHLLPCRVNDGPWQSGLVDLVAGDEIQFEVYSADLGGATRVDEQIFAHKLSDKTYRLRWRLYSQLNLHWQQQTQVQSLGGFDPLELDWLLDDSLWLDESNCKLTLYRHKKVLDQLKIGQYCHRTDWRLDRQNHYLYVADEETLTIYRLTDQGFERLATEANQDHMVLVLVNALNQHQQGMRHQMIAYTGEQLVYQQRFYNDQGVLSELIEQPLANDHPVVQDFAGETCTLKRPCSALLLGEPHYVSIEVDVAGRLDSVFVHNLAGEAQPLYQGIRAHVRAPNLVHLSGADDQYHYVFAASQAFLGFNEVLVFDQHNQLQQRLELPKDGFSQTSSKVVALQYLEARQQWFVALQQSVSLDPGSFGFHRYVGLLYDAKGQLSDQFNLSSIMYNTNLNQLVRWQWHQDELQLVYRISDGELVSHRLTPR